LPGRLYGPIKQGGIRKHWLTTTRPCALHGGNLIGYLHDYLKKNLKPVASELNG
jgi:hypothetical protein